MNCKMKYRLTPMAWAILATASAWAQQAPDAGQTLQQLQRSAPVPLPENRVLVLPAPATPIPAHGGPQVLIKTVKIEGNTVFSSSTLQGILGDVSIQALDLAGMNALAAKVTEFYRSNGYPFTKAILPAQPLTDGTLRIHVVEGRYGEVKAVADEAILADSAQRFLSPLQTGKIIENATLERVALILENLPGIAIEPMIKSGGADSTADLTVTVKREKLYDGSIDLDNHGDRFTGEHRIRANLNVNSPFMLGDQINVRGTYSDEGLWLGGLSYSLPLGASGLQGNFGYLHTYYKLAKDFASSNASGTADVSTLGLSYPLLRSQAINLTVAATLQHKQLNDKVGSSNSDDFKSSDSLPISLQFEQRDGLAGGGFTYGNFGVALGSLGLSAALEANDIASGRNSRGHFTKTNLDIARLQSTAVSSLSLFGRLSGQVTNKNLDSSEKFSLGGPDGVRAYPVGEGIGDEGWMAQLEMRYAVGAFTPFAFYDAGYVKLNSNTSGMTPAVTTNQRSIAGWGVGMRYNEGRWNADLSVAWRSSGGEPQADKASRDPRAWLSLGYRF